MPKATLFVALALIAAQASCSERESPRLDLETKPVPVEATLRRAEKAGRFTIEIKSIGDCPFTFLDIREGSGFCDMFWEVEARLASGRLLANVMHYSPGDGPFEASIDAGKTYVREINLGAYLGFDYPTADEEVTITVHYRDKFPRSPSRSREVRPDPTPTFSTKPIKIMVFDLVQ